MMLLRGDTANFFKMIYAKQREPLVPVTHDTAGKFIGTVEGRREATSDFHYLWCKHLGPVADACFEGSY